MGIDKNKSQLTASTELRSHAEKRLRAKTAQLHPPRNEEETQRLVHELEVHQIELEMQNAELRQARDDAEAAMEKYADLYDFAPIGYFTLDHEGIIRSVNLAGASLVGVVRSGLLGRRFGHFATNEARSVFTEFLGKVFTNPAKEVCEVAVRKEGNSPLFVRIEGVAAASGQECRLAVIDITERKRDEENLRESEERLRRLIDSQFIGHRGDDGGRESEDRLRLLIDGAKDYAIFMLDVDGRVTSWNEGAKRLKGWDAQEILGRSFSLFYTGEAVAAGHPEHELEIAATEGRHEEEGWRVRKDGSKFMAEVVINAIRDDSGKLLGFSKITRDITERRRAEKALRESEAKYRNLFENMTEEVHFWKLVRDEAGQIKTWELVDANPPTLKSWGRTTLEEIKGKTTDEIFGPGAADHYLPVVQKIMTEGVPYVFEDYFPNLDKHFRFTSVPLGDHFITTGADITGIKKAHAALQESESRFRTMTNAMPQLAWIARADGHIFWYNQRWYDYSGTAPEQMEGWGWQSVHDPIELPKVLERWQASIATGEPFEMTFPLRGADGVFRPFLTRVIPMKDAAGRVLQWFGTNTDISVLKQAEEQIKASLAEKEVMLREIHHRVKNNLQVISSLVGLQADGLADEQMREVFHDVRDRVRSMALVHEKLYQTGDLARIDFAEYATNLLNYLWRAHGSATTAVSLSFDLEPLPLPVDTAVPCGLILNELAGNALKHAFRGRNAGEVIVSLKETPQGRISLSVRDNGVGVPEELDWRKTRSLGLRLVQMLAGQLGATVELDRGGGTEFRITFTLPETAKGGGTIA